MFHRFSIIYLGSSVISTSVAISAQACARPTSSVPRSGVMVAYYEGIFPGPKTEMLVVCVSGNSECRLGVLAAPTVYLRWQDVQFTAILKCARSECPPGVPEAPAIKDLLPQLPGCKVLVTIDDVEDTIAIRVQQDTNTELGSAGWCKKMWGDMRWPLLVSSLPWT